MSLKTMHCANIRSKRKWANKSRIGAYIRGEIKLEDIVHPSKIIKPKERHNRRSRILNGEPNAHHQTLSPSNDKIVVHKDVESKIRPYIEGLKSIKDLMHPSKFSARANVNSRALPAFFELVEESHCRRRNAVVGDDGHFQFVNSADSSKSTSDSSVRGTNFSNFPNLLAVLEKPSSNSDEAVVDVDDGRSRRFVTVLIADARITAGERQQLAQRENSITSAMATATSQDRVHVPSITAPKPEQAPIIFACGGYSVASAKSLWPGIRGYRKRVSKAPTSVIQFSRDEPNGFPERNGDCRLQQTSIVSFPDLNSRSGGETNDSYSSRQSHPAEAVEKSPSPRRRQFSTNSCTHSSGELIAKLYQRIQTLLEERVECLIYNQRQNEKMESLRTENFHLRTVIAKIGEKLNDIEGNVDTLNAARQTNSNSDHIKGAPVCQEKLKAQNQRLLKTIASMNTYLTNFAKKCGGSDECGQQVTANVKCYKNLYEKEAKNFERHKRKCEMQRRHLLHECDQLHRRLHELDSQNVEMAGKLSYVPIKIQLVCRQYQDIIEKLNDELICLRNLERKNKKSTFGPEKSYSNNFSWH